MTAPEPGAELATRPTETGLPETGPHRAEAAGELEHLRARVAELETALATANRNLGASAQLRLEVLLVSSPAGLAIWVAGDRLVAFNPQYADIFFPGHSSLVGLGVVSAATSALFHIGSVLFG